MGDPRQYRYAIVLLIVLFLVSLKSPRGIEEGLRLDDSVLPRKWSDTTLVSCSKDVPDALAFIEPLVPSIKPSDIVIFSGGDSLKRRSSGFGKVSADSLEKFAKHHGYRIIFLDQMEYNRSLKVGNVQYTGHWHRAFAMPDLRVKFPDAKYFVWFDDDIMVPYPETDMLNHYVNLMEADPNWEMLYGDEGAHYVLNSGMYIAKNTDLSFHAYSEAILIGLENDARLSHTFGHEQEAIIIYRERFNVKDKIRVIGHRESVYNFNTLCRHVSWDPPAMVARDGDAFVHFAGLNPAERINLMGSMLRRIGAWRKQRRHCKYPVALRR